MKRKIFITTALVCCFMVCLAIAIADLNGKWNGVLLAPDGNEYPLSYTYKIDGDKLTGVGSSPQGDVPLTDGKVTGNDFSYNISVNGMDFKNTGKFYPEADSIGLDIDFNGMKMHTTLKRSK